MAGRSRSRASAASCLALVAALTLPVGAQDLRPELVLQSGHSDSVNALAFTPDSHYLISGSHDHSIRLWDLRVLRQVRVLGHHTREVNVLAMCPDGRCVVSGGNDVGLHLWELPSGKLLRSFSGHTESIKSLAVTSGGRYLISGSGDPADFEGRRPDYTARVWDLRSGQMLRRFAGHEKIVGSLALYEPSGLLASGSYDGTLKIWDLRSGRLIRTIKGFPTHMDVSFTRDGRSLVTACRRGVELWDVATGNLITVLGKDPKPYQIAVSPTGAVAAYPSDAGIGLIDLQARRMIAMLPPTPSSGRKGNAQSLAFSNDGQRLAAGFIDGRIGLWEVATQRLVGELRGYTAPVQSVAIAGTGRWIATGTDEGGAIRVWDTESGRLVRSLPHGNRVTFALRFNPEGRWLAVSGGNYNEELLERPIDVWDVATGLRIASFSQRGKHVENLAWSLDSRCLGSSADGVVKVFDLRTKREIATLPSAARILEFGSDCQWIATSSLANDLTYRELPSGRILQRRDDVGWGYQLSGNREWLLSIGWTKVFKLLHLPSDRWQTFTGHREFVTDVALSDDSRLVASASWDGDVRIWNAQTGRVLQTLPSSTQVESVAFTLHAKEVIAGYHDGTVRIWDVASGRELLTLVALRGSADWLAVTPDGLFDGTASAMQQVAWRIAGTDDTVPLERFFSDFYRPGLLADVLAGERPKAPVDVATVVQVPGLRRMLLDNLAHLEVRGNHALVCLHDVPGVAVGIAAGDTDVPTETQGYRVVPGDATCKYQLELPGSGSPADVVARLQPAAAPTKTRWEGKPTLTARSTLHVLCIGVSDYAASSGLDPLPYAAPSAKTVEAFFMGQAARPKRPYKQVKVWPGLYDGAATRDAIRRRLDELSAALQPDDVLFLYLVGHGLVPPGEEMFSFVPFDGREGEIATTGISTAMLAEQLRATEAQRFAIVIDSCQAGAATEALGRIGEEKARRAERVSGILGGGGYVIGSTLPLAYAAQLHSKTSALAATLLEGLGLHDGSVRMSEVLEHIRTRLPEVSSRTIGFRQVPLTASAGSDFNIATN